MVQSRGAVFMFQSELRHLSSDFVIKKLPPPTPDRYEGRLFPPEQSWKTSRLLNERAANGNQFYIRKFSRGLSVAMTTCRTSGNSMSCTKEFVGE